MAIDPPTHAEQRALHSRGADLVAGLDEVGRGAWAGPVTVAAAVTGLTEPPDGLTDSKLLTLRRRTVLEPLLRAWVGGYALGHAQPEEIDRLGMTAALRLAAGRALAALPTRPDAVLLDGKHDYLGAPWRVRTVVKGDQSCTAIAAASVLAKVARDRMMAEFGAGYPEFAFDSNVGYPSAVHRAALQTHGPTPWHRLSWAYLDHLPAWRHLKKQRGVSEREDLAEHGQLTLDE